jgi:hypothetical protein
MIINTPLRDGLVEFDNGGLNSQDGADIGFGSRVCPRAIGGVAGFRRAKRGENELYQGTCFIIIVNPSSQAPND